jgi:thymidylate synthase
MRLTNEGFPGDHKKLHLKSIIFELLGFLKGDIISNIFKKVKIWDAWADTSGDLGPVYGGQWRNWNEEIDQIKI